MRHRPLIPLATALLVALSACSTPSGAGGAPGAADAAVLAQLAPTGRVRVAVAVGPSGSTFRATLDPTTGRARGVPVDLANALGKQLGVPVEIVPFGNYPELLEAGARGGWDVTFLPFDAERAKIIDYGPAYYNQEYTYLVPGGSPVRAVADVDRPGVRLAVAEGSVTARNREAALKSATIVRFRTLGEIRDQLRAGTVDATGAGRETLVGLAVQVPDSRVLPDSFLVERVAAGVPRGRPAALAWVSDFVEAAKREGVVRRAFDDAGFAQAAVAPPATAR
jgi:polar amino acid transport system substrate-binding protein